MTKKCDLSFDPPMADFYAARLGSAYTALAGPNNAGKSLVLKYLKQSLGRAAYVVGTNRFYHVYHFTTALKERNELDQFESNFSSQFNNEQYNFEQNFIDLNKIITILSDTRRDQLFQLCGALIGGTFALKKVDPDNELSPRYIDMDGQNISVGSTGTRLLMTLLGLCLDERFSSLLIDEPELGLGPRLQQTFAGLLQDPEKRSATFPHLKHVVVATHSQLFLHRRDLASNFVVTKNGTTISVRPVDSIAGFHRLQFNLLGNDLETMYFPAAIVVVEGKTDHEYLDRLIQLRHPSRRVTVLHGAGDVKNKVYALREAFGDLARSPMRGRLFVVVDSVHPLGLASDLEQMGVARDNFVAWSRNGIEYFYPPDALAQVYSCSPGDVGTLAIDGDRVTLNGTTLTKNELKAAVLSHLGSATVGPEELEARLMSKLASAIS